MACSATRSRQLAFAKALRHYDDSRGPASEAHTFVWRFHLDHRSCVKDLGGLTGQDNHAEPDRVLLVFDGSRTVPAGVLFEVPVGQTIQRVTLAPGLRR